MSNKTSQNFADYTPQKWDYVIMEEAGGWGYHPDNNGCLAIIEKVGARTVGKDFSVKTIFGKLINPKTNNSVKFSDIPQFGHNRELIFRKATSEEILKFTLEKTVETPPSNKNLFAFRGTGNTDLQELIKNHFKALGVSNPEGFNITSFDQYYYSWNGKIERNKQLPKGYIEKDAKTYFYMQEEAPKVTEEWSEGTYAVGIGGNFEVFSKSDYPITIGKVYTIKENHTGTVVLKDSQFWVYKMNLKWFATKEEAMSFALQITSPVKESTIKEDFSTVSRTELNNGWDNVYPVTPEEAFFKDSHTKTEVFPNKELKKQLRIVKFQTVVEVKTVEEKLLKKTKSKLFNI